MAIIVPLLIAVMFIAQQPANAQSIRVQHADAASPEAVVNTLYESITRNPGEQFDWPRFCSLFLPTATMMPSLNQVGGVTTVLSVEEFIKWVDEHTVVGGENDKGFQEREVTHGVDRFGDIAQVFSEYEKGFRGSREILGRGINSIQLVRRTDRWWISSIVWDEETATRSLAQRMGAESDHRAALNKMMVALFFNEVQNNDRVELVDSLFADSSVFNGKFFDKERFKDRRRSGTSAFKDFIISIDDLIAVGDMVIARTSATATNVGEWFGFPGTNQQIHMRAIDYFELAGGKIIEQWHIADRLGTIIEMGYLPAPGQEKHQGFLARVNMFRAATKAGDTTLIKRFISKGARRWFGTIQGPGMPVGATGKGPWSDWDEFFNARSTIQRYEIDDSTVTVVGEEANDFFVLIGRKPVPTHVKYWFDNDGRIGKILIFRTTKPKDDFEEFKQWAQTSHPKELQYLMPDGEIIPTLDRAARFKQLLKDWRKTRSEQ